MNKHSFNRRELMRVLAAAGLGAPLVSRLVADETDKAAAASADKIPEGKLIPTEQRALYPARVVGGKVIQPERPLEMLPEVDVLVVGGGPAGFAAAIASARAGAKTALVERYGYFGGQWTGGLVLLVISTHARDGDKLVKVMRGIGDELVERVRTMPGGGAFYRGKEEFNPTTDPEATKIAMDDMIRESGAKVYFHSWAADVVMDGPAVRGVVLESKAGRKAILAKVVVDATGDGDIFAAAGAEHEQRLHAIGLVHRLGNVDRVDREKLKAAGFKSLGNMTPLPSVNWINLRGPSTNALDIEELTRLEFEHRRTIWEHLQKMRAVPGGESLYLVGTGPQLGVRMSRVLAGTARMTKQDAMAGKKVPDVIGVGGAQGAKHGGWPIPYGVMVPAKLDNLLAAGRCVCMDEKWIEDMRLISACLITGHAAGVAAAVSAKAGCRPRDVDVGRVQGILREQGAYLG